jgi:pimeloyl-ACP methyl ester carboxylesterase
MRLRACIVTVAAVLALFAPVGAGPMPAAPLATAVSLAAVSLPADLNGTLNGVPYRIRVPANWNGTLLVYAHAYAETPLVPVLVPTGADEAALLGKGFALAASRFQGSVPMPGLPNNMEGGWTTKYALQDIVALTTAFGDMVGAPRRTMIWGKSMGGLITLGAVEKFPGLFDAAIALCPPAAGTPRVQDHKLDVTLAYAVAFGWNDAWGRPGALRPDLDFMSEINPTVQGQLGDEWKGRWEFLRLVNGIPSDRSFYAPRNYRGDTLYMAIMPRVDLDRRAGGYAAENIGRVYTLTGDEKAYLWNTFGLDAEPLLARMNEQAIYRSDRNARNYAEHYLDPTGVIRRPVLTLHTTGDALAIPNNESAYFEAVEARGNLDLLVQQFTAGNGAMNTHCTFTSAQDLAAVDAMMHWLDTGERPGDSFFPLGLGFVRPYAANPWRW